MQGPIIIGSKQKRGQGSNLVAKKPDMLTLFMARVPICYRLTQAGDKLSYTFIQVNLCKSRDGELLQNLCVLFFFLNNVNIVYRVKIKERTDNKIIQSKPS